MTKNSSSHLVSSLIFKSLCIDHGNPYLRWTGINGSLVSQARKTAKLRDCLPGLCLKASPLPWTKTKNQKATKDLLLNTSKTEILTTDDKFSLFQVSDSTITLLSKTLNCLSKPDNVECFLTLKTSFFFLLSTLVKP